MVCIKMRMLPLILFVLGSLMIPVHLEATSATAALAYHLPNPPRANCSSDYWQCDNGGCIPKDSVCNCINDCGEGSDERDCNDYRKPGDNNGFRAYYCPDGGCIKYRDMCKPSASGAFTYHTCRDLNCSSVAPCHNLQFECPSGKCLQPFERCNVYKDCEDGSDELNCTGKCIGFLCSNGNCVSQWALCDCKDDCGDGSDEVNCEGENSKGIDIKCSIGGCSRISRVTSKCSSGACILGSDLCNCKKDCDDGSDEENCDGRTFQCPDGTCLLSNKLCNCEVDCGDGADEENCEKECGKFLCPLNATYLDAKYLNDGFDDCGDGADENYCSAESFQCGPRGCFRNTSICDNNYGCTERSDGANCIGTCSEFQCPGGGPCIHNNKVCDCVNDCENGADERNCRGLYKKLWREKNSFLTHTAAKYHCLDGECLVEKWYEHFYKECNYRWDCKDWSDTMECAGKCDQFECPSGRCIHWQWHCDGVNDCGDWADEKLCPGATLEDDVDNESDNSALPEWDQGIKSYNKVFGKYTDVCHEKQFRCNSGQCVWTTFCKSHSASCRDGSDYENCGVEERFQGPFNDTFSNNQCRFIDGKEGISLKFCLSWCEAHIDCTAVNYNEEYEGGGCVIRACPFPVPHPYGKEPDKLWKGYSRKPYCSEGSTYQTTFQGSNRSSICTCVDDKYECKERVCVKGSAIILDDGCNYCICENEEYKFCTQRTCAPKENLTIDDGSPKESLPNDDELPKESLPKELPSTEDPAAYIDPDSSKYKADEVSAHSANQGTHRFDKPGFGH